MQRTKLPKLYAELLYDITKGVDDSAVPEVIERFVQLVKKRRPSDTFWHKITTSFYKLYQVREGIVEAHVTLRSQPTKEEREEILHFIKELYSDKQISIIEHIDTKVLGGVQIQIEDRLFDFTIRNSLRSLEKQLTHN
jgi:ATP synthase F1 delta subunit